METSLLCVTWLVLMLYGTSTAVLDECRSSGNTEIKYDTTCPNNCSQEPPRIPGDTAFFNCSIGVQKDVDLYRKLHPEEFQPQASVFDAPEIKAVEFYWKSFKNDHQEPALKINFSLPKGLLHDWQLPKAVLLKFQSLPGRFEDEYYTKCPKERIFEFHGYSTKNSYDLLNPRELMFDCLVGLKDILVEERLVYNITLQTVEGKNASYITMVTVRTEQHSKWQPVVMTHLNETDKSLYVVIEQPPSMYNILEYAVRLVQEGSTTTLQKATVQIKASNWTRFVNLTGGRHSIQVMPECDGQCNEKVRMVTESYVIDGGLLPVSSTESPHYLDGTMRPLKLVAMVSGCILGVMLLLFIAYYIRWRPKRREHISGTLPLGIIIHPYEKGTNGGYSVVINLKRYINIHFNCRVTESMELHPRTAHFSNTTAVDKIERALTECSFALVLYSSQSLNYNATDYDADFYSCFLNSAIKRRHEHNDLRVIPLHFAFNRHCDVPSVFSKLNITPCYFIEDQDKVYNRIHGLKKLPANMKGLLSKSVLSSSTNGQELHRAINCVLNYGRTNSDEYEPLIPQTGRSLEENAQEKSHSVNAQEKSTKKCPVSCNATDIFAKMAKFNEENCSEFGDTYNPITDVRNSDSAHIAQTDSSNEIPVENKTNPCHSGTQNFRTKGTYAGNNTSSHIPKQSELPKMSKHVQPHIHNFEVDIHHPDEDVMHSNPLHGRKLKNELADQTYSLHTEMSSLPPYPIDISNRQHIPQVNDQSEMNQHFNKKGINYSEHRSNMARESQIPNALQPDVHFENCNHLQPHKSDTAAPERRPIEFIPMSMNAETVYMEYDLTNGCLLKDRHGSYSGHDAGLHHHEPSYLHEDRHHYPHHIQNAVLCSRNPIYTKNHVHQAGNQHCDTNIHNYGSHYNHGSTHQHMSGIQGHQDPSPIDFMLPYNMDEGDYTDYHPSNLQNQNRYFNETGPLLKQAASDMQARFSTTPKQASPSLQFSFDAVDPPDKEKKEIVQKVDINKKYEDAKRNTAELQKPCSVQSLPTDLDDVLWYEPENYKSNSREPLEDLQNYSPEPPQDFDQESITDSQIMDELSEINKSNLKSC